MKKLFIVLALASISLSSMAQDAEPTLKYSVATNSFWSNWFIQVGGDFNSFLSSEEHGRGFDNGDHFGLFAGDRTSIGGSLAIGKWFTPGLGLRTKVQVLKGKKVDSPNPDDFDYWIANEQVLFNLSNIFSQYKESRRFNVVGFIGLGINHTLGFDDLTTWTTQAKERPYPVNTDDRTAIGMRAGLQLNYKLSNPLDLALDIAMNASDDKFNGVVYDDHYDGYVSAMIGLIYHFKDHYGDRRFMDINWTDADELARMNRNINDLRDQLRNTKPRVEYRDEYHYIDVLQTTVSFEIDKYNITKIQKKNVAEVAKYLENHPEVNLVVCGYADVETAYPEYNLKLSENRAKAVYNMLVKDFNVQPDRLRIDFKGDTVQPYGLKNEWNRVVIFVTEPNNK